MRLKELRQNKGVTQKEVAMKLNCTIDCYSKYERGLRSPDIDRLKSLSKIFWGQY